ncbi:DUF2721 domain-containing protein [Chitinolyticbacter meiyuanensis]|uniref:DUF2721 domain-containing protein n=1 Tax=Chitinolyticbacter meiyuanensis TaxID=682798 RepID=UPI0011E5F81D|nr:DUF2721 domain-containing protein [Chitinolyticbacter meiyuanensis]
MDEFSITTPSLLFPAISLLMLAYTNRFLALSTIIRQLYEAHHREPHANNLRQLGNLRRRVALIRGMQAFGIVSLLCCLVSMVLMFVHQPVGAQLLFGGSLLLMVVSLMLCLGEILISDSALNILLADIESELRKLE